MRVIQCCDCLSAELLPDFEGPKADEKDDPLLGLLSVQHRGPLNRQQLKGRPHNAPRPRDIPEDFIDCDICHRAGCRICNGTGQLQRWPHLLRMYAVDQKNWDSKEFRKKFIEQMWLREGHVGYPPEFYDVKDTFREDAGYCFNKHGRPDQFCIDWQADSKKLTDPKWRQRDYDARKTQERAKLVALGLVPENEPIRKDVFLCDFCVVASYVQYKKHEKEGLYDGSIG